MRRVYIYDHLTKRLHESVLPLVDVGTEALHDLVRRAFRAHFDADPVQLAVWEPDDLTAEGYASGMNVTVERASQDAADTVCLECRRAA